MSATIIRFPDRSRSTSPIEDNTVQALVNLLETAFDHTTEGQRQKEARETHRLLKTINAKLDRMIRQQSI